MSGDRAGEGRSGDSWGWGSFDVSWPLLVELMHMPHGTELQAVEMKDRNIIEFTVAHPDIPNDGESVVRMNPTCIKESIRWEWNADVVNDESSDDETPAKAPVGPNHG